MRFDEIMDQLPKLTLEELRQISRRLAELDEVADCGAEISAAEIALIEERCAELQRDPSTGVGLEEMEKRLRVRFGSGSKS